MPNRPLLILPAPGRPAERNNKTGGDDRIHKPTHGRQVKRLDPQFEALQQIFAQAQADTTGTVPEQVLVLEIVGEVVEFIKAIQVIPGMEWLTEFDEEDIPPDDNFFVLGKDKEQRKDKPLRGRVYLIFTNQRALTELLSLWKMWKAKKTLPRGLTKWRHVFDRLREIRPWGTRDRLLDTGVLADWRERVAENQEMVPCEIELWFRQNPEQRRATAERVRALVAVQGGQVVTEATVEEIRYQAILARLPIGAVELLLLDIGRESDLVQCEQIQFFRATGQIAVDYSVNERAAEPPLATLVSGVATPAVAALLDGLPVQNHQRLAGRLNIDDPDDFAPLYGAAARCHGTAMASIVLHGDLNCNEPPLARPLYVRPILVPDQRTWRTTRYECVPDDILIVDLVHRAVKRMFDGEGHQPATAPHVTVVNLALGIRDRPFYGPLSPLARLLDWLAWRYRILFIVSAGNYPGLIELSVTPGAYDNLTEQEIQTHVIQAVAADARNRRLLSPAEAINVISVGATHTDFSVFNSFGGNIDPYVDRHLPSPINAQGMGYRRAIKPDVLAPGGRVVMSRDLTQHSKAMLRPFTGTAQPGQRVAAPGTAPGDLTATSHVRGTSSATALTTRAAIQLYDVLEELRLEPGGDLIANVPRAVWQKALLVHSAEWGSVEKIMERVLKTDDNSRQFREYLTRLLGYGMIDVARVSECTEYRVTALGGGVLANDQAHTHSFPLPPSLSGQPGWRRLVVTLAWLTPINIAHQKWRRADLWFTPNLKRLGVERQQAHNKAVLRGTVQHEIMEGIDATAFTAGDNIEIQVNCRADAGYLDEPVPYALAVTLEIAEEIGVDIYDEVRSLIQPRVRVSQLG